MRERNRFLLKSTSLLLLMLLLAYVGCEVKAEDRYLKQYESQLKTMYSDYSFKKLEFVKSFTVEDSLKEVMERYQSHYNRAVAQYENEMERSQSTFIENQSDESLRMAKMHVASMERYDSLKKGVKDQIERLHKDNNIALEQVAVHSFMNNGILMKLLVRFDKNGKLTYKGAAMEAEYFNLEYPGLEGHDL